uniref:Uncharacterized protein n=1 Tax=Megaselia scalaris TaxID=36166 RepID=T1GR19_MEGSC
MDLQSFYQEYISPHFVRAFIVCISFKMLQFQKTLVILLAMLMGFAFYYGIQLFDFIFEDTNLFNIDLFKKSIAVWTGTILGMLSYSLTMGRSLFQTYIFALIGSFISTLYIEIKQEL